MNKLLLLLSFLYAVNSIASDFCTRTQTDIKSLLSDPASRIAFKNDGGLFDRGVCWWHGRLQRSSAYLVKFDPDANLPTPAQLKKILHSLQVMNQVVVIPGYGNFESFSRDHRDKVQNLLDGWQKLDGFFNFEWLRGISGRSSLPAEAMRARMDNVYLHYQNSPTPLWIMAQVKGLTSHSLLILDMLKTPSGYDLSVIDSNHPSKNVFIEYHEGDTALKATGESYSFVPYVGFQNDFRLIANALQKECKNLDEIIDLGNMRDGEIENYLQY